MISLRHGKSSDPRESLGPYAGAGDRDIDFKGGGGAFLHPQHSSSVSMLLSARWASSVRLRVFGVSCPNIRGDIVYV